MKRKTVIATTVASLIIAASSTFAAAAYHRYAGPQENGTGITPHNWTLTPVGDQITLGDFPMGGALSPDGNYLIISNDGQGAESLQVVDTKIKCFWRFIRKSLDHFFCFGINNLQRLCTLSIV